jgi:hypothetical protein
MSNLKLVCGNCQFVEIEPNKSSGSCRFNPPTLLRRFLQIDEQGSFKNIKAVTVTPPIETTNTACSKFKAVKNA